MNRVVTKSLLGALLVVLLAGCASAGDQEIVIDQPMEAPEWALLQQELLAANAEGARVFADEYLDDRGYLIHVTRWGGNDGPDDAMENFHNWPLGYALGSPESLIEDYSKAWEGHLVQFTEARAPGIWAAENGMYHREFITAFDWEHNGEGLQSFYWYGLGKPNDPVYRDRVVRFAGFYNGDDPEVQNYDPEHRIIRSLHNGSLGPKMTPASEMDWGGLPVEGEPQRLERYSTASNIVGDHPLNLLSTTLGFLAYMFTGEERYRDWVLEYTGAWRERILENGGNIPTNIGLDGTIGGEWDGRWYGGVFGWNFDSTTSSRNYFMRGPRVSMGNALLLTGDRSWVDPMRAQIDNLYAASQVREDDGAILMPNKHGDDGWWGYIPNRHGNVERDIYLWTLDEADKERIRDHAWIRFLDGENPDYPVSSLRSALQNSRNRVQMIREEDAPLEERWTTWRSDRFYRFNPVQTTPLVNQMLGANDPGDPGNSLHAQVRYFDPQGQRAGIPEDVGALVTRITPEGVTLTLVNTSQTTAREVVVQGGAYGEHQFTTVTANGSVEQIGSETFTVRLQPGSGSTLEIGMQRYANQPTLSFPWDR